MPVNEKIYEFEVKISYYLMVAHSAGIVTSLTLLKDYKGNEALVGIGKFIAVFGVGLIFAILSYLLLAIEYSLDEDNNKELRERISTFGTIATVLSGTLLVGAIVALIYHYIGY